MFKRALDLLNRSAAVAEESNVDGGVDDTQPLPPPSTTVGKNDLENPLLETSSDDSEVPTIPPFPGGCGCGCCCGFSITKILKDPRCGWVVLGLVFLALFVKLVCLLVAVVNRIHNDPGFELDSVVVSSFNVSKTFPKTRWDTELSLSLPNGDFSDLDVRYEAPRLWLYSEDEGFVSMTSPISMEYSPDGKKLVIRAVFGMEEDVQHLVVNLDVLIESNTISIKKVHSSKVEVKSFLMIDCSDLKIEFDLLNTKVGTLVDVGKSCRVQICLIESHPLYDGADNCTSNSYKFRVEKLRV